MSEQLCKAALLKWLEDEMQDESDGYRAAIKWTALHIEKGEFDADPAEMERLANELRLRPDVATQCEHTAKLERIFNELFGSQAKGSKQ